MSWRKYVLLYFLALAVLVGVAVFQTAPGYMDADYYLLGGLRLASGHGFTEPVLWNYLDDPQGFPHPSHAYWMPLPSVVSAVGIGLFPRLASFEAARILFIILAAAIPPLTARLALDLTRRSSSATFAGTIALLPVFYLPYLPTTDTFVQSMLLGAIFFLLLMRQKTTLGIVFAIGAVAGLMHLTRAEGLIWLPIAVYGFWLKRVPWVGLLTALGGYLLVTIPWLLRNLNAFGALFPPGGLRTLWLTNYNELFAYPAEVLNFQHLFASGLKAIFVARTLALGQNLLSAFVVEGSIFLVPLVVWGVWHLRHQVGVRAAAISWLALLLTMSLLFPFSGTRGGFFHAAAALQPMVWALAAVGLSSFAKWGARRRGWAFENALKLFGNASLIFALVFTGFVLKVRVVGTDFSEPIWNVSTHTYAGLGEFLGELGVKSDSIVMVNNPPGFHLATGYPAIVVPDGNTDTSLAAAREYGATVFLLESNHPVGLDALYLDPADVAGLSYIATTNGTHVFFVKP